VSDFNEKLAKVRRTILPNEMMLLAGLSMGNNIDPLNFVDHIRKGVAASSGIIPRVIKQKKINAKYLVDKLQSMVPELIEVLVERLGEWQRLNIDEAMAYDGLPSISTLARLGLALPDKGDIAWGWFCFRNGSSVYEFVLHHPERMPETESRTTYELASELVGLIDASPSPQNDALVWDCVYRIVKASGWRRCLVAVDDHSVKVKEIPIAHLLQGRYDGTLEKGVIIAGVNAPDPFER